MPRKPITLEDVRQFVLALPGVAESTIHGAPCWKWSGKLLTCPAIHKSAEPDTLAVKIAPADRERLLAAEPDVYYVTDHYANSSLVLVRLDRLDRRSLLALLKNAREFLDAAETTTASRPRRPRTQ